jgi:hypothetical protein
MAEDYFNESANIGSMGISLSELMEYYRTLCEQ